MLWLVITTLFTWTLQHKAHFYKSAFFPDLTVCITFYVLTVWCTVGRYSYKCAL